MRGTPGRRHFRVGSSIATVAAPALTLDSSSSLKTRGSGFAAGVGGGVPLATAAVARVLPLTSPYKLTPPPCHTPEKSGCPSAVRGIFDCASAGSAAKTSPTSKCLTMRLLLLGRRPEKHLVAVGEGDVPRGDAISGITGFPAIDGDQVALLHQAAGETSAAQCVGRIALHAPAHHVSVGILNVDINVGVGISPFDFGDRSLQRDRRAGIVFRREGMMRQSG